MMIVGVLTFVATERNSVAEAGFAAACAGIGTAICGPYAGTLADRFSQRAVLIASSLLSVTAVTSFLALVAGGAPFTLQLIVAFVLGGATPQVAPFSRARLVVFASSARTPHKRDRAISMVMSYESVMDETSFVIGPVLVGVLTALIAPWAPLVFSAIITATIVIAFAVHSSAVFRPVTEASTASPRGRVFSSRILLLALGMFLVGSVFGSTLTALIEFMTVRDLGAQTGIAYGAMSAGAIITAIVLATLPRALTLRMRWIVFAALGLAGTLALASSSTVPAMAVALFFSGCGIGAVLVSLFSLGSEEAPAGRSTTVLTTLQSSIVVGQALSTAGSGLVAEMWGASAGFAVAVLSTTLLMLLGILYALRCRSTSTP
jgi:MFS family permease